jgi:hypothetical protein
MCLAFVTTVVKNPSDKIHTGYKVYREGVNGHYASDMYGEEYYIGKWYTCKHKDAEIYPSLQLKTVTADNGKQYSVGFHIYTALRSAEKHCAWTSKHIYQVEYRQVSTIGQQDGRRVAIAKQMRIVKKLKSGKDY